MGSGWLHLTPTTELRNGAVARVLLTALVVPALGSCANDGQPGLSSFPPSLSADSSAPVTDASPGAKDARAWCIDVRIPIGCFHDVPEAPPGQSIDTESLTLRLAGYNGDSPLDHPIERVSDSQACTTTGLEWYYREDAEAPLLMLCHNACSIGSQGGQGLLWIRATCL